ncbi:Guanylate cyclase soluble subunit beta-2, partial [Cichlidogyrus casuarinus]
LLKSSKYEFVPRGPTEIKGKGVMQTYFLKSDGKTVLDCNVGDISTPQLEAIPNGNAATEQVNFGHIHLCAKDFCILKLGQKRWQAIVDELDLDESRDFVMFNAYPDSIFYKIIDAISVDLGLPLEETIEAFGQQFFEYLKSLGYHTMIVSLGCDIKTLLQNLDSLHEYFAVSQAKMIAPSFRVEICAEGILLYYNSSRKGLWPLILGESAQLLRTS